MDIDTRCLGWRWEWERGGGMAINRFSQCWLAISYYGRWQWLTKGLSVPACIADSENCVQTRLAYQYAGWNIVNHSWRTNCEVVCQLWLMPSSTVGSNTCSCEPNLCLGEHRNMRHYFHGKWTRHIIKMDIPLVNIRIYNFGGEGGIPYLHSSFEGTGAF